MSCRCRQSCCCGVGGQTEEEDTTSSGGCATLRTRRHHPVVSPLAATSSVDFGRIRRSATIPQRSGGAVPPLSSLNLWPKPVAPNLDALPDSSTQRRKNRQLRSGPSFSQATLYSYTRKLRSSGDATQSYARSEASTVDSIPLQPPPSTASSSVSFDGRFGHFTPLFIGSPPLYSRSRGVTKSVPVSLRVYDLSFGKAATWSKFLLGQDIGGIWHTAIDVYGELFQFFGGRILQSTSEEFDEREQMSPVNIHDLGFTEVHKNSLLGYLHFLSEKFTYESYDITEWNCNHFTDYVARFLVGKQIPDYIVQTPLQVKSALLGRVVVDVISKYNMSSMSSLNSKLASTEVSDKRTSESLSQQTSLETEQQEALEV